MVLTGDLRPEYHRDLYGDSTIGWVPPVTNYAYVENVSKRGINDNVFRWEEVSIDLTSIQSGAVLNFLMPDYYLLQITPDIGWHDTLAMFGETKDYSIQNPHLKNLGPFSITAGTLSDKSDNSVFVELTDEQLQSAVIDGFPKYLWRAVPWADGNPGLGGLPTSFEWISSLDQLVFTIDDLQKETRKNTQVISGTKSARVNITVESDNETSSFVEQTSTTWKVLINIDRPKIKLTIIATDEGGSAVAKHYVDLDFKDREQFDGHVWNAFDGFALLASVDRLPKETNASLRERTIDAFKNRGGTHYRGLVNGVNRELNLKRKDDALTIKRSTNLDNIFASQRIVIESTHTRVSVTCEGFTINDELVEIDSYYNTVTLSKRISQLLILKTSSNQEIHESKYHTLEGPEYSDQKTILLSPEYSGIIKVTYQYKEDIPITGTTTVADIISGLEAIRTPINEQLLTVQLQSTMSGSESAKNLYRVFTTIGKGQPEIQIGWSPIGLFSVSNEEYKWSFVDEDGLFFNSNYYQYVIELKSHTNIEWGFIVADKDYWDAVDADWYGRDSLPIAFDVKLSKYRTALPIGTRSKDFDGWEALRMGYYYEGNLIKNVGFPQVAFKSGVGYKRDCAVSITNINVSSKETRINFNPLTISQKDSFGFSNAAIQTIAIAF